MKQFLKTIPNSVLFWNTILLISLIICGFVNLIVLLIILLIMSCIAVDNIVQSVRNETIIERNIWIIFTPIYWFLVIVFVLDDVVKFVYKKLILKFNNFLNSKQ